MIIDEIVRRINKLPKGASKVLYLCHKKYNELMLWAVKKGSSFSGDTGYDQDQGCYVFAGIQIKCAKG